jgi:ABC-type lipoprotein export system ATPase subunit
VLGRYGLSGDLALQKSETLSGGQKSRVVWAHMSMKNPHIMVFDEPTNHLDIETVDVLVQALNAFQGMGLKQDIILLLALVFFCRYMLFIYVSFTFYFMFVVF